MGQHSMMNRQQKELKKIFEKKFNLFYSHEEISENDYIEWSLISNNLIKKNVKNFVNKLIYIKLMIINII